MGIRGDAIGLFWEDIPLEGKRGARRARPMPPIPETGWEPPKELPNLAAAKVISLDTETYDPGLPDFGPGWGRGVGHIVGVSIGTDDGASWYFPIRHEVDTHHNLDPNHVLAWLRDSLCNPHQPKVGANLMYDLGWLRQEGIEVKGELVDVQYAEALLSESSRVGLEILGQKYLGEGKESNMLYDWLSLYYGGVANDKQRANIYRSPPCLAGPYAESDATLPIRLARTMYPMLVQEGLLDLFRMECALIPLLIQMRWEGVRVDVAKAEELADTLGKEISLKHEELDARAGMRVDINSSASLARAFDTLGLTYGRTAKGAPSFTKGFLEKVNHPVGQIIRDIRNYEKIKGTFLESYILESHINKRIFCQFHPLRGDATGTRSGRFSSTTPNLQNIPARDPNLSPRIRGLFIPEDGHKAWRKYDESQVEYRFLIHYAVGEGSEEARENFRRDPDIDYHDMTMDLVAPQAGWDVSTKSLRKHWRRPIKNINFGLIYGMGVAKLSADLGLSPKEGKDLFSVYHKAVPFAKATMDQCTALAQQHGFITTILNRKSRFDLWEPIGWDNNGVPLPYDQALLKYGNIQRAATHKALNRRLQGSAADLMKAAMLKCWQDGVFNVTGVPKITVHDELDFSDPGGKDEAFNEVAHIMETALDGVLIPFRVDCEVGPDWGHVK